MNTIFAAQWQVDEPQLRVTEGDARTALRRITGQPAVSARARLRFGPGRTCEPVARLLDRAIVQAEVAGLDRRCSWWPTAARRPPRISSGCGARTASRTGSTAPPARSGSSCGRPACARPAVRTCSRHPKSGPSACPQRQRGLALGIHAGARAGASYRSAAGFGGGWGYGGRRGRGG